MRPLWQELYAQRKLLLGRFSRKATIEQTTVLVAHNQSVILSALVGMIDRNADLDVVASANDFTDALRLAKSHSPDVILFAVALPTGIVRLDEQITALVDSAPRSAVAVLTASCSAPVARAALQAGAAGYILESELPAAIPTAIRKLASAKQWVSPRVKDAVAALGRENAERTMSPQDQSIIRALSWGHTNKEIAAQMGLSQRTIEANRAKIMSKLGLSSRAGIVNYAVESGLFDEADAMTVPPVALS